MIWPNINYLHYFETQESCTDVFYVSAEFDFIRYCSCLYFLNIPPICHMEDQPTPPLCCSQLRCPANVTITIPEGYKSQYPGPEYSYHPGPGYNIVGKQKEVLIVS